MSYGRTASFVSLMLVVLVAALLALVVTAQRGEATPVYSAIRHTSHADLTRFVEPPDNVPADYPQSAYLVLVPNPDGSDMAYSLMIEEPGY